MGGGGVARLMMTSKDDYIQRFFSRGNCSIAFYDRYKFIILYDNKQGSQVNDERSAG